MFSPDDYVEMEHQMKAAHGLKDRTPTRVSIREANEHLQLLHQRVSDLEDIIRSQGIALSEKDAHYRQQMKELKDLKDRHIEELSRAVVKLEEKNRDMDKEVRIRTAKLEESQEKVLQLDKFLSTSLPTFEKFLNELKQFSLKTSELINQTSTANSASATPEKRSTISTASSHVLMSNSSKGTPQKSICDSPKNISNFSVPKLAIDCTAGSDSGHPSSNNSESSRANSYNLVLHELKGQYEKALHREQVIMSEHSRGTSLDNPLDTVSEPIQPRNSKHSKSHHHRHSSNKAPRKAPNPATQALLNGAGGGVGGHGHGQTSSHGTPHASPRTVLLQASGSPTGSGESTPSTSGKGRRSLPKTADLLQNRSANYLISQAPPVAAVEASQLVAQQDSPHNSSRSHISLKVGRSFSITSNFSEDEEDDSNEPPPPPAPPASKNSNQDLPSLQAPRRYYQSSY